jgi:hypothetical protein
VLLAGALVAGCGGASTPTPAASRPAFGASGRSAIFECLKKHGVNLPGAGAGGFGGGGRPSGNFPTARPSNFPTSRPAGGFGGGFPGGSSTFRKALKACGASFPAAGNAG